MRPTPWLAGLVALLPLLAGCMGPPPEPGDTRGTATNSTLFELPSAEEVEARNVTYHGDVTGFLARPAEGRDVPGVVMIHEWWGLTDHVRDMARVLAADGYAVLAVDLFGTVATTPEEARAQVQALNQTEATANLRGAVRWLREEEGAPAIASLGWCFGGGQSLQLALSGEHLDGTVIYYGNLVTDADRLAAIGWPVLGIFGAEDRSIPLSDVQAFDAALDRVGVPHEVHVYPGVGHAFANPSGPSFDANATRDAWAKTLAFLGRSLKDTGPTA